MITGLLDESLGKSFVLEKGSTFILTTEESFKEIGTHEKMWCSYAA